MMDKIRNSMQFDLIKPGKLVDLATQSRLAADFVARRRAFFRGKFEDR